MTEQILLCEVRTPFGESPQNVLELSQDYIDEVLSDYVKDNLVDLENYTVSFDEVRDGEIVHNGLVMPAGKRTYYLNIATVPKATKSSVPKEPSLNGSKNYMETS